jgi:hypothetical protein
MSARTLSAWLTTLSIGMRYRFVLMTWPLGESTYQ